jgi:vitamin B12 transporter
LKIRFKPLALLLTGTVSFSVCAAETDLAAIVVTATRQPMRVNETLADVTVIDRETIERSGQNTVADLLARQPGVQLIANGGPGASASILLRGAEARHTLVLIDGMRIRSATSGQPALESIPLGEIERIEILRGPASALYGSEAIGGVVQIFTRRYEGPLRPSAYVGYGSYNTLQTEAGIGGSQDALSFGLRAGRYDSDGFNVTKPEIGKKYNPDKDGFHQKHLSGHLSYRLNEGDELGATFLYADGTDQYDASTGSFDDRIDKTLASYQMHLLKRLLPDWTSQWRIGGSRDELLDITQTAQSRIRTDQRLYQWQNDIRLPLGRALVAIERSEDRFSGTTHFAVDQRSVNSGLLGWSARGDKHNFQANLRHDDNSQFGGKTTWQAGYGYRLTEVWRAHAATGTAFNAPTFNQLYYPGFGNPSLRPEFARNIEIGLAYTQTDQTTSLTVFRNRIQDMIPSNLAANINRARIEGATFAYAGTWAGWRLTASMDVLDARDETTGKRLPRRANHLLNGSATRDVGAWNVGAEWSDVGQRYEDSANTTARRMTGYSVVNLFARYRIDPAWSVEARANNIANVKYETAYGYAMPGGNLFVGLRYAPR